MIKNANQYEVNREWLLRYKEAIEAEKIKHQAVIEAYQSQVESLEAEIAEWEAKPVCKECYNGNYRWTTWNTEKCPSCGKSQWDCQREGIFEKGRKAIEES